MKSLSKSIQGLGGSVIPAALGHQTIRAGTGDLAAVASVDLFNVLGGDILLTGLYGRVTTEMAAANTLIQLQHTPAIGLVTVDLCAIIAAHIGGDIVDTIYTITGDHTVALQTDATFEGVAVGSFSTNFDILVPGVISMDVTAFANTGVIQWVIHWVPLSERSTVVVA
jgi:hypothetical protein